MPTSTVKLAFAPKNEPTLRCKLPGKLLHFVPSSRGWFSRLAGAFAILAACGFLFLTTSGEAMGQTVRAWIKVTSLDPARVHVQLELPTVTKVLSFRNTYGDVLGLGERIENVLAQGHPVDDVIVKKLAPGEFENESQATRFDYDVILREPPRPAQMSHVSWLNREHGLLMLADLLPKIPKTPGITFQINVEVPAGWTTASNIKTDKKQQYSTDDVDTAVFIVGPALHEKTERIGSLNFSLITSGKWPFSDSDAIKISRKIIEEYSKVTGFKLRRNAVVMLIPFPGDVGPESWTAETRGNAVVLLLGNGKSGKKGLARLGVVLSHELFHLWVPNSLKLEGDYDWFFEGFTLYQALRTDLRLKLISFETYLATLAQVYDSYLSSNGQDKLSLLELSARRWTTSPSAVYEKGMLVALIYDLSLRKLTGCKASLDDLYGQLFRSYSTGHGNANETIIELLSKPEGMESFAKNYVQLPVRVDLEPELLSYGVQIQRGVTGTRATPATKLVVRQDLNKAQRKLLGCLGYRG